MKFREDSKTLFTSIEIFVNWIANQRPPWASYRVFMSVCLIALDKLPAVHPVLVGETCRRVFKKCVLEVTGPEATNAFQDDQLCDRIKVVIDGAVHGIQAIWGANFPCMTGYFY